MKILRYDEFMALKKQLGPVNENPVEAVNKL